MWEQERPAMERTLKRVYTEAQDRGLKPERYFTSVYEDTGELWGHLVLLDGPELDMRATSAQSLLETQINETPLLAATDHTFRVDNSYVRCRVLSEPDQNVTADTNEV